MRPQLLSWQWSLYPDGHRDRRNLLLHLASAPLFIAGTVALLTSPFTSGWNALGGLVAMVLPIAVQGRGHKLEQARPVPFEGPLDVASRLFVEQWVTFPRFVLSGAFARAWQDAGRSSLEQR